MTNSFDNSNESVAKCYKFTVHYLPIIIYTTKQVNRIHIRYFIFNAPNLRINHIKNDHRHLQLVHCLSAVITCSVHVPCSPEVLMCMNHTDYELHQQFAQGSVAIFTNNTSSKVIIYLACCTYSSSYLTRKISKDTCLCTDHEKTNAENHVNN